MNPTSPALESTLRPPVVDGGPTSAPAETRRLRAWLVLGNSIAGLLVLALCTFVLSESRAGFRQRALDSASNLALTLQQGVESDLMRIDAVLQSALRDHVREAAVHPETALARTLAQQPPLTGLPGLSLTDAAGAVSAGVGIGTTVRGLDFFEELRSDERSGVVISEPYASAGGQWQIAVARRLQMPDGAFAGIAFAAVPTEHFQRLFRRVQFGSGSSIALRSSTMRLVARITPDGAADPGLGTTHVSGRLRDAISGDPAGGIVVAHSPLDAVERISAYQRVGEAPLYVIVGLATEGFQGPWWQEVLVVCGFGALVLGLLVGSSLLVLRAARLEEASHRVLRREAARQRAFMQASSDGIHVLDRDGILVDLGDAFASMLGYTRAEMIGMNHARWDLRYLQPERIERFRRFQVGRTYRFVTRHRCKDGTLLDVEVASVGARIDGRDLLYCAARDIGERVQAERVLRNREALLDRTGRVAGVGGWELDLRSGELECSAQILRILDAPPGLRPTLDTMLGYYDARVREQMREAVQAAMHDGRPWDTEVQITTASGRRAWVRSLGEVEYENGDPARLVGAMQDITERRQRIAELERERGLRAQIERHAAELNTLLHERSEMLDVLAHEVRQPLNNASAALQSMARALPASGDDPAVLRLARAQTVMGQVLANIDNTLAAAALLARADPIEREDADIDTLVAVAIADLPPAGRPRIRVHRETHTRTAAMDTGLMRLALRNLLLNALKHGAPDTPVEITLSDSDAPLALLIDVADHGGGVDPAIVPRLFERGTRSQRPGTPPGHGLGLYIVRRVMELHAGRVELVRNGDDGASFRLVVVQEA